MKHLLAAVALLIAGCASDFSTPRAQVKYLDGETGSCSGVVLTPTVMLTAKHCDSAGAMTVNGKPVKVIARYADHDLMLLSGEFTCPCASPARALPAIDEEVIVVGFPFGAQVGTQFVTLGRYQGPFAREPGAFSVSAHASPGNSGGGVFVYRTGQWQLVGILVSGTGSRDGYINHVVAIPSLLFGRTV